jgi:hypothetical protein
MASRKRSLAAEIDARLRKAGVADDDPGLVHIRAWNRDVLASAAGSYLSAVAQQNGRRQKGA